ncbi:hypothetical protein AWB68_07181 [Caballeronia choica]|jgi:hypothetical protein|uniref:Uncharacterized protein n=1 Tax=Caballeronia choica TaxID=326476 RepID=A0A158KSI2_9BURK|nr:hypothetical protein AWB68_07181 [Caballeronia choica]
MTLNNGEGDDCEHEDEQDKCLQRVAEHEVDGARTEEEQEHRFAQDLKHRLAPAMSGPRLDDIAAEALLQFGNLRIAQATYDRICLTGCMGRPPGRRRLPTAGFAALRCES